MLDCKAARRERKRTQKEIADSVGIPRSLLPAAYLRRASRRAADAEAREALRVLVE